MRPAAALQPHRFGPEGRFELQPLERRLLVDGEPASLGARAFDLLLELSARPGELRSKNELIEAVWPGVVVEEGNLATQISALRKVLGGELIATIPGRGYRFAVPLQPAEVSWPPDPPPAAPSTPERPAATSFRTNLPADRLPLIGRADDLATLGASIDERRQVSLVGPGGVGKTRLAQTLLAARVAAYPHGVCWVDLASVVVPQAQASDVAPVVAAALGLTLGAGDPVHALCTAMSTLEVLVALDGAEPIVEGVAGLAHALWERAPGVRLLVTSQVPLRLAFEWVHRVEPLGVPVQPVAADRAEGYGAVALFAARATQADSRWRLDDENVQAVIAVCRDLDGLPLAIELAAARTPLLGVQRLAASMQDRLRLLTASRDRQAPARQQTLRATLEWSHSFLDARERAVFRRLAVFAGSAGLSLIQQVVADPAGPLDEWAVLDALVGLVDRSLVAVVTAPDVGDPRYRLLDSPRAFARERLAEAGEEAEWSRRHALAMVDRYVQAWPEPFAGRIGLEDWHEAMAPDLDNGRRAFEWACAAGERRLALQIAATLLLALPKAATREELALGERCEPWLASPDADPITRALLVWRMARSLQNVSLHRVRDLVSAALQALSEDAAAEDDAARWLRYALLTVRCFVYAVLGEASDAAQTLEAIRRLESPRWPPHRRLYGGQAAYMLATQSGDWPVAIAELDRTAALARGAGMSWTQLRAHRVDIELASGDAAAAARTGEALLASVSGGRDQVVRVYAQLNYTSALLALGDAAKARPVLRAGWAQAAVFACGPSFADNLALLAALEHRPRAASRLVGFADAANEAVGARQANEAGAIDRARALAREAVGPGEFDRLYAEGRLLRDEQIAAIAFAETDA